MSHSNPEIAGPAALTRRSTPIVTLSERSESKGREVEGRLGLSLVALAFVAGCGALQPATGVPGQARADRTRSASSYSVLYRFANRVHAGRRRFHGGYGPLAPLIDVDGTLFGTTFYGGYHPCSGGCGTVYGISKSGAHTVLYRFDGGSDGASPWAGLLDVNTTLYGTTYSGGGSTYDYSGTLYSVTTSGVASVLHRFTGGSGGANPVAGLAAVAGTLYGTTLYGGTASECLARQYGCGTVYSISSEGAFQVLYRFEGGSDGAGPAARLIDVHGTLYGTTEGGGDTSCGSTEGCGTVYSVSRSGKEKVLHRFSGGSDGRHPQSGLIDVNGTLYGTTAAGGAFDEGTVYSITATGTENVVYSFAGGSDGARPTAGLIDVKGLLYGTTSQGGGGECYSGSGCGTIYSVTPTGSENVLHSFGGAPDGAVPQAELTNVRGTLYGTTAYGGGGTCVGAERGCGTVFSLTP